MSLLSPRESPGYRPVRDGVLTGLAISLVALICVIYLNTQAVRNQEFAIREDLSRLARGASGLVNGDLHESLARPEQMGSPEYREALEPLIAYHRNLPEIAYLYTLVERDGRFYFGLDTAVASDRLGFHRKMEPSPLLTPYASQSPEEDAAEMEALRKGEVFVSQKPYRDAYGVFLTAVAPIFNSRGKVVGIVGVDLNVADYLDRMRDIRTAGGVSIVIALVLGSLLGVVVWRIRRHSLREVREKLQAMSEKTILENRDRQLIKAFGQIVYRHRLDQDHIEWSGDSCKILGMTPEELPENSTGWLKNIHPEDQPRVQSEYEKMVAGQPFDAEYRFRQKDGSYVWIHDRGMILDDEESGIVYIDGVLQDISERKSTEEQMLLAKERAETGERTKTEFLAVMSHEIRTPLNGVLGYANLLLETPLTGRQREYLESIQLCSKSLLGLLNDILDFSKMESGKLEVEKMAFSLQKKLHAVAAMYSHQAAAKNLDLTCLIDPGAPDWIYGDSNKLRQVLFNLIGNAVKFTEKGHVHVHLQPAASPQWFRVVVEDTGIGIPPDKLSRLFKPFSQADSSISRKYGGTGLGLAICARLVEMMKGTMHVESEPGRGSHFIVELPFEPAPPEESPPPVPALEPPPPRRDAMPSLHILVAEDNTVNRRLISHVLRDLGHQATLVNNGRECVNAAQSGQFDLILLDLQMPEMNGYEAARNLREQGSTIWITALTAEAMADDRDKCLAAGMDDYVAKPFTKNLIRDAIERFLHARAGTPAPTAGA